MQPQPRWPPLRESEAGSCTMSARSRSVQAWGYALRHDLSVSCHDYIQCTSSQKVQSFVMMAFAGPHLTLHSKDHHQPDATLCWTSSTSALRGKPIVFVEFSIERNHFRRCAFRMWLLIVARAEQSLVGKGSLCISYWPQLMLHNRCRTIYVAA